MTELVISAAWQWDLGYYDCDMIRDARQLTTVTDYVSDDCISREKLLHQ